MDDGTRVVTFKAPAKLIREIDMIAAMKGVPRSEIIRRALKEYIIRFEANNHQKTRIVKLYS